MPLSDPHMRPRIPARRGRHLAGQRWPETLHYRKNEKRIGLVWFGLLGFNASATARVISRR